MSMKVDLEVIYEGESESVKESVDLGVGKSKISLMVGLGNGIYKEIRCCGGDFEGVKEFSLILAAGGFDSFCPQVLEGKTLWRPGDVCFPSQTPIVFMPPSLMC